VKKKAAALLALLAVLSLLAACGDDDDKTASAGDVKTTTTTAAPAAADVPKAIVSISPTATEMLFAIGAGDQVIAVDDQSTYPTDAPKTDLSSFEPNVEAIAGYEPDLVVSSSSDPEIVGGLEKLGIEVLVQEAAVELTDVYAQIEELGVKTGHEEQANELSAGIQADINGIAATAKDRGGLTAYWELDPTYYSVTSKTFIGKLLALAHVTSIADEADAEANDYPQLSSEYIVQADPDLIVLADTKCCQQSAAAVAGRPGWDGLKAVKNGTVIELDDDIASRWGPRIVDLLQAIDEAASKAA
jgi:iron complex transport system substrate-binding protein